MGIEKRRRLPRQASDGDGGRLKRRWLDDIENDLSERTGRKRKTELNGGIS